MERGPVLTVAGSAPFADAPEVLGAEGAFCVAITEENQLTGFGWDGACGVGNDGPGRVGGGHDVTSSLLVYAAV